jgi:putative ABC transport system permease protein
MLRLLRTVSLRDYRAAPARLALMIGGIASGVALIAALGIINGSVIDNFRATLEQAAGKAELQVTLGMGEVGFDESLVQDAAAVDGVAHAFGFLRGMMVTADDSQEVLQLFGIDLTSEVQSYYDVDILERDNEGFEVLLNDPTSVFLTEEYAARLHIVRDQSVRVVTPTGIQSLRVRGFLRPGGVANYFGGNLAIMDLPAAQRLLERDRRVNQIDVIPQPGANLERIKERLEAALPSSLSVTRPALRSERFEQVVAAFQAMVDSLSFLGLLAGAFIVYNTSSTAVIQRARDLAVLIALGASRRIIFAQVISEAAILGLLASLIGIACGRLLASGLLGLVAQAMGVIYQMRFPLRSLVVSWDQFLWCMILGTGGAIAAGLFPAYKASRLDPLELMRSDFRERLAISSPNRVLVAAWLVLIAVTAVAVYTETLTRSLRLDNVVNGMWCLSMVVISIPIMSWTTGTLRRVLPRLFGVDGRIAAEYLARSPGRTGVTTAVIALSLAIAVALSSVSLSFRESERNWYILRGDLIVSSVATQGGWLEAPLSARVGDTLRADPDVMQIETYRALAGQEYADPRTGRSARITIAAVSPGFIDSDLFRHQVVAGDAREAVRAITMRDGVAVSDNLADRFGISPGQRITLPTPSGERAFDVRAIVAFDYSGDQGSVILNSRDFADIWHDDQVSHWSLFLKPGADLEQVRNRLVAGIGRTNRLKILTVPNTLAYHQHKVDQAFAFTYAIQLLVIAVTLAGIFDLLVTQMLERRREMGIFRTIGADDRRIARSILHEALAIGTVGALLGCVLGAGTSLLWVHVNFRILIGYIIEHHYAVLTAGWCLVLAAGVAVLAGLLAARRALREPVLDSLRYE